MIEQSEIDSLLKKIRDVIESGEVDVHVDADAGVSEDADKVISYMNRTNELCEDIDIYKTSVNLSDVLMCLLDLMKETDKFKSSNLIRIIIAQLVMFEDRGLIKIIKKDDRE